MFGDTGAVRTVARSWLRQTFTGLRSSRDDLPVSRSLAVDERREFRGSYNIFDGRVTLRRDVWETLRNAHGRISRGIRVTPDEGQAIRLLLHEEMHHHSAFTPSSYSGVGRDLEEGLIEMHAIEAAALLLRRGRSLLPSLYYDEQVRSIEHAVARSDAPSDAERSKARRRAMEAARVVWSGGPIHTPNDYTDRLMDALEVPTFERDEFVKRLEGRRR